MKRNVLLVLALANAGFCAAPAWFTAMKDNTWTTVAGGSGQTLASVCPSPLPPGAEGQNAVMNDWTGGCSNQTTGEYLLPAQGGHNGYYGNEIYALALRDAAPAWKRIWGPTPNTLIITNDLPCSNPPYTGYADNSPRSTHGWFQQLCSSDGRIWTTMQDADPSGCWTSEVYSIDRSNLSAGWTFHGRLWITKPVSFGYQSGPGTYDPVANKIWRAGDYATDNGIAGIDVETALAAGEQPHTGSNPVPGGTLYNAYLSGNTTLSGGWSVVLHDMSPRCWLIGSTQTGLINLVNLEGDPSKLTRVTTTGSPAGLTGHVGAVYHRASHSILVGGSEYGVEIRRLSISGTNPLTATYAWSALPLDASNTVVPSNGSSYQGTYSKFQMIEDMGNGQAAICLVTSVTGPTYVYKVPGMLSSVEQRLPRGSVANMTSHLPDAIYDIRGHRVSRPSQSGVYLYRMHGKTEKRLHLQ